VSTWEHFDVACPRCGAGFRAPVLKGVHISWLPEVRETVRDGTFARHTCPSCGLTVQIESSTAYTDFEHGQYVGVESPERTDWRVARAHHLRVFDECFTFGPPVAEELAGSMIHRVVFGVHALREKVLVWDAGLDDRAVEAVCISKTNHSFGSVASERPAWGRRTGWIDAARNVSSVTMRRSRSGRGRSWALIPPGRGGDR